jgi:hypothetical protein
MKRGIDVSVLSVDEFRDFLYSSTVICNRLDGGLGYLDPEFRRQEGQEPQNIKKYGLFVDGTGRVDVAGMKELAEKTPEDVAFVLRYRSGELRGVFRLPGAISKEHPQIKKF